VAERRLLAICLDAADERLVRELIDAGRLPALERLCNEGGWADVRSPDVGSLAPHPTFSTGDSFEVHRAHAEWPWVPERMAVTHVHTGHLRPFWQAAHDEEGRSVGIMDVPFHVHAGLTRGFEITEWGAHDVMTGVMRATPPELVAELDAVPHPFTLGRARTNTPRRDADLADTVSGCVDGATLRGELALRLLARTRPELGIIAFSEIHRASHDLWHEVEPDHPLYDDMAAGPGDGLAEVYRAVDTQVGRLVDHADDDTAVVAYSLFGMRPGRGLAPTILPPVLEALGYARPARAPGRRALAAVKARLPRAVKQLYDRRVPMATRHRLAVPTILEPLDWSMTRAFALPSDQHGWVRINLVGREAEGIVARRDYRALRDEVANALSQLRTTDGRPIVRDVGPVTADGEPHDALPDLIVHWADAAFDRPVRLRAPALTSVPRVPAKTGQHRPEGFCIGRGIDLPSVVDVAELGARFARG
jgi:predicted AlkP superfamily phosphohydrolase/phosphomutase